jgi:hypothetical protein
MNKKYLMNSKRNNIRTQQESREDNNQAYKQITIGGAKTI